MEPLESDKQLNHLLFSLGQLDGITDIQMCCKVLNEGSIHETLVDLFIWFSLCGVPEQRFVERIEVHFGQFYEFNT